MTNNAIIIEKLPDEDGGSRVVKLMTNGQVSTDTDYATATFEQGTDLTQYDALVVKMHEDETFVSLGAVFYSGGTSDFYCYGDLTYTMKLTSTTIRCTHYTGKYRNLYVDVYGITL